MFLKAVANPFDNNRFAWSVLYRPKQGQTFAINAERLHRNPNLLNAFGPWRGPLIRTLDVVAFCLLGLGLFMALKAAWWLFIPCFFANLGMLIVNRRTAGQMARDAARQSSENFLYLHENEAIWLVPEKHAA